MSTELAELEERIAALDGELRTLVERYLRP